VVLSDDPNGPNPVKLKKPIRLKEECSWYVRLELFLPIEVFMDHLDFDTRPWDIEDPETGKREIYVEDKNILRKMYKLKNIYENHQRQQEQKSPGINSNNWNFGSIPKQLLKKS